MDSVSRRTKQVVGFHFHFLLKPGQLNALGGQNGRRSGGNVLVPASNSCKEVSQC
jgi:hypothetical protein